MFALLAGVSYVAVEKLEDRETVVSSPDAVAEQFTRSVMAKRWKPAREYLEDPDSLSDEELESMQKEFGEGENVEADMVSRDERHALVTVRIPSRGVVRNFELAFRAQWLVVSR